mmetsp:Transcript_8925/g.14516  ORF Transcript_8925/g.14516 Transcript_8925/m.14516 type:complete len:83 (-) Transcript_8925:49-297(-)|eukprot:CAMPEP_0203749628 /NCGR_PEP_ID=MMETSP0098-20131031/4117_1 /ASSEMBLY_ACC=CAM_ASM_000208 /TAXON_ID=96639 /ORGANISM=" , Strain NY0313808BC1" /LENGTH=82 /DNA_ID=CAMNT_0050638713 /DNA_START=195 /DNA_END=443 /DNA_ORIENTATION=-
MSQLFQRIAQYLANELVTKRLANSQTFMNAAHKTHQHVQKSKSLVNEHKDKVGENVVQGGKSAFGFLNEVRQELVKEVTKKN